MPEPVGREAPVLAERLLHGTAEHALAEVVGVEEAAGLVGEDQGVLAEDVGALAGELFSQTRREIQDALAAGLGDRHIAAAREAAGDPCRAALQVQVDPAKRRGLAQAGSGVGQEEDERVRLAEAGSDRGEERLELL